MVALWNYNQQRQASKQMLFNQQKVKFQEKEPVFRQSNQQQYSQQQFHPQFQPVVERHQGINVQSNVYPQFKPLKSSSIFGFKPSSNITKEDSGI